MAALLDQRAVVKAINAHLASELGAFAVVRVMGQPEPSEAEMTDAGTPGIKVVAIDRSKSSTHEAAHWSVRLTLNLYATAAQVRSDLGVLDTLLSRIDGAVSGVGITADGGLHVTRLHLLDSDTNEPALGDPNASERLVRGYAMFEGWAERSAGTTLDTT